MKGIRIVSSFQSIRCFSIVTSESTLDRLGHLMHGRKNRERRDSVTDEILLGRENHRLRLETIPINEYLIRDLEKLGLGSKKRKKIVFEKGGGTNAAAGGHAVHLASASTEWPIFRHLLPEIAFAGHSNSGKVDFLLDLSAHTVVFIYAEICSRL